MLAVDVQIFRMSAGAAVCCFDLDVLCFFVRAPWTLSKDIYIYFFFGGGGVLCSFSTYVYVHSKSAFISSRLDRL